MIQSIDDTAGKVWKFLNEKGEANLSQLKKGVKADPNLVLHAIGWLAREDKLIIEKKSGTSRIRWKNKEILIYDQIMIFK